MTESSSIELPPITDTNSLFTVLQEDIVILTPNHRSNVQILEAYGKYREQQGLSAVCQSPNIFPVDIWLRNNFDELLSVSTADSIKGLPVHIILQPFEELFLWKNIIQDSDIGTSLLNVEGTANSAIEAYRMIQQWEISLKEIEAYSSGFFAGTSPYEDVDIFLSWYAAYEKRAQQDNILSLSQLLNHFITAIQENHLKLPQNIILLGFENPPPLYQRLFQSLNQGNCKVSYHKLLALNPDIKKKSFNNQHHEMLAAALWSQQVLEKTPEAKVAIICPDIHARKAEIQRVFSNTFYPNKILNNDTPQNICFSASASENIESLPLIQTALMLLKLNQNTLPTLEVCQLIRSPFLLANNDEGDARAALEFRLRKNAEINVRLSSLRFLASQEGKTWHCPILGAALLEIENCRQRNKGNKHLAEWTHLIEQQLAFIIEPTILEQVLFVQQWHELLKGFQQLEHLSGAISFSAAIDLLSQLARNTKASTFFNQASIQLLSPIEASGLQFSHCWFMGLSENEWPPAANNNPFLPRKIQLKYKIPAANVELQYQLAKDLLQHFATATSTSLVLSHPLQAEDISLNPSLLLQQFPGVIEQQNFETLSEGLHPYSQDLFTLAKKNLQLEGLTDSLNIPLQEIETTTGGTALIADQAACPFRSFAKHRLKAVELPKLSYGLPAYAVGNMLHHAMEVFWQGLKDQHSIDQLNSTQQSALILKATSSAVKYITRRYPETMSERYCQMEIQRLSELLSLWLDEERKRGFFTVIEHEYTLQWQYAKLTLEFRIDRIEQFEDNSFGLVDYKTSKNNNNVNWFEERQEKPQLLLYLQAAEKDPKFQKVSSLLYAQVNIEDMRYRGIAENPDSYPGVALEKQRNRPESISWEELRAFWQQSLESLAQEFLDGYLPIEPKSVTSCQYCHLQALCRIQEKRQQL